MHTVTKAETAHAFSSTSLRTLVIARKVLSFIHFTHGFRSFHGSELKYFWNCVKQDGNNSHFSTHWRETHAQGVRVGRYTKLVYFMTSPQNFHRLARLQAVGKNVWRRPDCYSTGGQYHMKCLTNLRNKHRSHQRKKKSAETLEAEEEKRFNEARAFVELAEYI